jgi:uncharacterized membrane protein
MESRIRLFGHPVHQALAAFPVGLLAGAVLFDVLGLVGVWPRGTELAYGLLGAGLVAAIVVAPFGLIDLVAIPDGTRAARIGRWHGVGNTVVVVLFALSWLLRRQNDGAPTPFAVFLSLAAFGLVGLTAWLGGELVTRLAVGVSDGAHLDARSSLDGPAAPPPTRTTTTP